MSEKGNAKQVNYLKLQGKRQDKVLRQGSFAAVICIREGTFCQLPGFWKRASGPSKAPDGNSIVADVENVA